MTLVSDMPVTLQDILEALETLAPMQLAENWDNVGLQLGHRGWPVRRIMVALDPTLNVAEEAAQREADLVVTHHPLFLKTLRAVDCATPTGAVVERLLARRIGLVAVHPLQETAIVHTLETPVNLLAAFECLRHRPLRGHPGMDQEMPPFHMSERQGAQPVNQLAAIRCIEDLLQRAGVVQGTGSRIDRQQVQVVIAEQSHGLAGFDPTPHLPQCRERLRAAIDDIADKDQPAWLRQSRQQRFETG